MVTGPDFKRNAFILVPTSIPQLYVKNESMSLIIMCAKLKTYYKLGQKTWLYKAQIMKLIGKTGEEMGLW